MFGHIWTVLTNLLALLVVFGMFRAASTTFETITVSGLTLIYITAIASFTLISRSNVEMAQASLRSFHAWHAS
jgi:hypothetical protein